MSDTSWEAQQYRQGYIDGGVALEDDMAFEKALTKKEKKHDQRD
jgi:hypothetical protein